LIKKGDTSQTAFDQAKAARDEAAANVAKAKASEQQAQAGVDNAEINLGYTTIVSPIAGRIGATAVTEGNLVSANSGTLATVAQLDPIRAVFSVPSAELVRLQKEVGASTSAETRAAFVPEIMLPDGTRYDHPGTVAFADNQVDAATGTVAIYANFPNPEAMLLPGQFVTVLVHRATQKRMPVVPAAAVQRTRDGAQVYVVDGDDRVQLRNVELGPSVDGGYAVTSGLSDGELVIVSGLQKVKPGMTVAPSGAGTRPAEEDKTAGADVATGGDEAGEAAADEADKAGSDGSAPSGSDTSGG
jgi:membrane fusion protein (multidrug efflux system)